MCIDCRSCDKQTVEHRDQRPLPRIDDLSDHLHGTVLRYLVLKYSVAFICSLHIKSKPAVACKHRRCYLPFFGMSGILLTCIAPLQLTGVNLMFLVEQLCVCQYRIASVHWSFVACYLSHIIRTTAHQLQLCNKRSQTILAENLIFTNSLSGPLISR